MASEGADEPSAVDALGILAMSTVDIDPDLEHLELYTPEGLLTILRHGPRDAEAVVVCVGGALGGLLGPDKALYHRLGRDLAPSGIGVLRVSYRRPNDLAACTHDTVAAMEIAARNGANRFAILGHSFGGAVAIQAASHFPATIVPAIVTFATQAAGCEPVEGMGDRSLLLFHGTADAILPYQASQMVQMLAESGEVVLLEGADHGLRPAGDEVRTRLLDHLPAVLAAP